MSPVSPQRHLQKCWEACWHRARRPVEGVLLSEERAAEIAEQVMRNVALDLEKLPGEAEFTARVIEETTEATRDLVAGERRKIADPQLHHDPSDRRYPQNLDLDRLQRMHPERARAVARDFAHCALAAASSRIGWHHAGWPTGPWRSRTCHEPRRAACSPPSP